MIGKLFTHLPVFKQSSICYSNSTAGNQILFIQITKITINLQCSILVLQATPLSPTEGRECSLL